MADDHREQLRDVLAADMGYHLDPSRFYQAASQPKEVRWYEAGHFLTCTARKDMMAWLARHIPIDPVRSTCPP